MTKVNFAEYTSIVKQIAQRLGGNAIVRDNFCMDDIAGPDFELKINRSDDCKKIYVGVAEQEDFEGKDITSPLVVSMKMSAAKSIDVMVKDIERRVLGQAREYAKLVDTKRAEQKAQYADQVAIYRMFESKGLTLVKQHRNDDELDRNVIDNDDMLIKAIVNGARAISKRTKKGYRNVEIYKRYATEFSYYINQDKMSVELLTIISEAYNADRDSINFTIASDLPKRHTYKLSVRSTDLELNRKILEAADLEG